MRIIILISLITLLSGTIRICNAQKKEVREPWDTVWSETVERIGNRVSVTREHRGKTGLPWFQQYYLPIRTIVDTVSEGIIDLIEQNIQAALLVGLKHNDTSDMRVLCVHLFFSKTGKLQQINFSQPIDTKIARELIAEFRDSSNNWQYLFEQAGISLSRTLHLVCPAAYSVVNPHVTNNQVRKMELKDLLSSINYINEGDRIAWKSAKTITLKPVVFSDFVIVQ